MSNPLLTKEERRRLKAENRAKKNPITDVPIAQKNDHEKKVTVLCVRYGNKYGKEYVEKLRNMVARNLSLPYEFVCLTDDQHTLSGVRNIYQPASDYRQLWWHKVHMFDPDLDIKGRILYFDLDVVIHSNIDRLITNFNNQFVGIKDFNRKFHKGWKYLNSSVMSWTHGMESYVYEQFKQNRSQALRMHGDQDWIWKISNGRITFFPDVWIQSYKWEIRSREELISRDGRKGFKTIWEGSPNQQCCVAVFHGEPKPINLQDRLVVDHWK